ncbi:hypothetical protein CAOG_07169, partial [Capsaspora owczarzaki ATCC 30864]|uniref:hypothetical protein n=1 Tax=Capsaspora owczarzaki (strain ATCC 30864) TaxID=595528 RepID=UPI0003525D19
PATSGSASPARVVGSNHHLANAGASVPHSSSVLMGGLPPGANPAARCSGSDALRLIRENPANLKCADCSTPNPDWASTNLAVVVCLNCAIVHQSFGSHVSKIRAIQHNDWSMLAVDLLRTLGNKEANSVWEAEMHNMGVTKPGPEDANQIKQSFINTKYRQRSFLRVDPNLENEAYLALQLYSFVSTADLSRTLHLLASNADPSRASPLDRDGMKTPLHAAALAGQALQLQLLLSNGADSNLKDSAGMTPEMCARMCGQVKIANFLREARFELTDSLSRHLSVFVEESGNLPESHPVVLESKGLEARLEPERDAARQRLGLLSVQQFERLASDVYDEIDRRDSERSYRRSADHKRGEHVTVPHLPENPVFHTQRNQSRQKLSTLNNAQFVDLVSDILFESNRRKIPRRKPHDPHSAFGSQPDLSVPAGSLKNHAHWQDDAHIYDSVFDEQSATAAGLINRSSFAGQSREVVDSLKAELAVTTQMLQEAQVKSSTGGSAALEQLKATHRAEIEAERAKIRQLEMQLVKANSQSDGALRELASQHDLLLKSERERAEMLEKHLRSLKPDVNFTEQLEALKQKSEAAHDIAVQLQARVDELQADNQRLRRELSSHEAGFSGSIDQTKIQSLVDACASLRSVNSNLADERDQWAARCEDLQRQLNEHQAQQSTLQRKLTTMLTENERLRSNSTSSMSGSAAVAAKAVFDSGAGGRARAGSATAATAHSSSSSSSGASTPTIPTYAVPTTTKRPDPFAAFTEDDSLAESGVVDKARSDWEGDIQEQADNVHKAMQALMMAAKVNAHDRYEQVMDLLSSSLTSMSNLCVGNEPYRVKFRAGLTILINASRKLNVIAAKASGGDDESVQNMITLAYEIAKIAKQLVTILEHV